MKRKLHFGTSIRSQVLEGLLIFPIVHSMHKISLVSLVTKTGSRD